MQSVLGRARSKMKSSLKGEQKQQPTEKKF
jgi:hypothetical protein